MDKEEKINLDDAFGYDDEEEEEPEKDEEKTPVNMEEILEKNIEERNKSNIKDKEIISKFNKENFKQEEKLEKIVDQLDLVEKTLLENQDNKNIKEIKEEEIKLKEDQKKDKKIIEKNEIKINPNKYHITLPEEFKNKNPSPFDFIDFIERKYNKYILDKEHDKYFYLEKYIKKGKFQGINCYKFIQKKSITNHILKSENIFSKNKSKIKITCIAVNNDLIYIGDNNGLITIFSINSELEIGPLNHKDNNEIQENENMSVTSMDILNKKNLLVCGFYNGLVEIWDLKNKICKKQLNKNLTEHKGQILSVKFLNEKNKIIEIISSDSNGLVNITNLTEKLLTFKKNAELNAEVNVLIDYYQPIYAIEILKFTEEEKKMSFFKNNNIIEIVGFACYDYVLIYQISPSLIELYKLTRPSYFKDFHIANISFGLGYIPRTKDIIDINKDKNQKLNFNASENFFDSKNINRLIAVSWDTFINIYAIKYDKEKGVEKIVFVGYYIHSSQIKRLLFVGESTIFIYDKNGKFKLFNTGLLTPEELNFKKIKNEPLYEKSKEKRALIQEMKNVTNKVQKQNYFVQSTKNDNKILMDNYYNSFYAYENNIYILGEDDLQFGKIYSWEECIDKLKEDSDYINAFILGIKLFKGEREYITFSGLPIDTNKRKELISNKMQKIIKEYVQDHTKLDKGQINEIKYNKIIKECILLSLEFCFAIESCNFLFKELLPIYSKKNFEKLFFENLEPYIICCDLGTQIFDEQIIKKIVALYTEKKEYQKLGQIIKSLYLSIGNSETVANRVKIYDTIFTGLITFCSSDKNEDYMFPAREIYSYFQKAKKIPYELYLKEKFIDEKKYKKIFYFDYENIINNIDIDELILSYQYLGSLLLWYIKLCYEGYKFPSGKLINDKIYEELIQQLFLWLINDEVLTNLIEFDCYSIFAILKKIFMKKLKYLKKIEYSDLFKLIKIDNKDLNEANIQKYFEVIYKKGLKIDNIYVKDDLYDFICSVATIIQLEPDKENKDENENNILMKALKYIIKYEDNKRNIEIFERNLLNKNIDNYEQNLELKEKYDRYCMHLKKYEDKTYIMKLINIIIAAIENNNKLFSKQKLETLLSWAENTNLIKVKVYLANKIGDFLKCLDIYLKEFKGEEQIILIYNFINSELIKYKEDKIKYEKIKGNILERITEIASLSIEKIIELTENYFNSNYAEILFRINNNQVKLKYLEEIIDKYKEDNLNPDEPETKEYQKILKLHIDLLINLKYYNQILPNLKKRNLYPVKYCLEKCRELKIYDSCIYLEKICGNFPEAIKLVNLLTKEYFNSFKSFYHENYNIIKNYKENENSEDEDESIDEMVENEGKIFIKKEDEILYKKKLLIRNKDKVLKFGIEVCEESSQIALEESKKNWQSLITTYYELINEIKLNISKKEIEQKLGEDLIKDLENRAGEITEKMNSYFDLNSVLLLISQIQGESFGAKEYKSLLKRLLFSGESFNIILKSAEYILKNNILKSKKDYENNVIIGKNFYCEKCDFCQKKFKENDKNTILLFNCGHKCHYECCVFLNKEISCRICYEYEKENDETIYRGEIEIKLPEKVQDNRKKSFHKKSNNSGINAKIDRDKMKKLKLINDINEGFFSISKIFEGN